MEVWDAIRSKRAVRNFQQRPLDEAHVHRILDAGRRSQSSKNSQPWQFIVIQDRDTLQKLSQMGTYLGHVAGAALCVVMCVPAGVPTGAPGPEDRTIWHFFDIGQSASYMQLAALEIGVGSCLGTIYDVDGSRALLGIPADWQARILISFGYPAEQQRPGRGREGRHTLEEIVHWDQW